jgi:hypothetical protein
MTTPTGGAFPSKQDDQPGMTLLEYFMAHAPFDMTDVPVTKPGGWEAHGRDIDLTNDERLDLLVTLRYDYAVKCLAKARGA